MNKKSQYEVTDTGGNKSTGKRKQVIIPKEELQKLLNDNVPADYPSLRNPIQRRLDKLPKNDKDIKPRSLASIHRQIILASGRIEHVKDLTTEIEVQNKLLRLIDDGTYFWYKTMSTGISSHQEKEKFYKEIYGEQYVVRQHDNVKKYMVDCEKKHPTYSKEECFTKYIIDWEKEEKEKDKIYKAAKNAAKVKKDKRKEKQENKKKAASRSKSARSKTTSGHEGVFGRDDLPPNDFDRQPGDPFLE